MPYYTSSSDKNKDTNLISTILQKYKIKDEVFKKMKERDPLLEYSLRFYNPYDTPFEDSILMELSQRLRLVNTGSKTCLLLSEDLKFISRLKELIQRASLPFFSVVNEVSILFEASSESVNQVGSIQKLVFGAIRQNKTLKSFIMNVLSDLKVILRTYDGDISESMDWKEMLAYLSDHRNPFVTVQLLPEFIEPKEGLIALMPDDMAQKDAQKVDSHEIDILSEGQSSQIYRGTPDIDGGTHPYWNQTFKIPFQPPKLTNCPVLFTDIMELTIENVRKYIIVMVRVAPDKSLFMTAYDPRSSTDYVLFGAPKLWCEKDVTIMDVAKLKKLSDMEQDSSIKSSLDIFQKQLDSLISAHAASIGSTKSIFKLGPAITPRLLVSVYNLKSESDVELLGYSQVSISSVLSGTGNKVTHWAKLMHETVSTVAGNNQITFLEAGSMQMQLEYTKESELLAIEESKLNAKERRKQSSLIPNEETGKVKGDQSRSAETEEIKKNRKDIEDLSVQRESLLKEIEILKKETIRPLNEESKFLTEKLHKLKEEVTSLNSQLEQKSQQILVEQKEVQTLPLPSPAPSIKAEVDSESPQRYDGSVDEILRGIVHVFIERYKKRNSGGTGNSAVILKPFLRTLQGFVAEKENDEITPYILEQLLNDHLIEITSNDTEVI